MTAIRLRRLTATSLVAIATAGAVVAPAHAAQTKPDRPAGHRVVLGFSDQDSATFASPLFLKLKTRSNLTKTRYILPWNVLDDAADPASPSYFRYQQLTNWMDSATTANMDIMLSLSPVQRAPHTWADPPSVRSFARHFRALLKAYPDVHEWAAWNEPDCGRNHVSASRAAKYFIAAVRVEKKMHRNDTLVAGEFCGVRNSRAYKRGGYIGDYLRTLRVHHVVPHVVGFHPYSDVEKRNTVGTRLMLRATRGIKAQLWLDETGVVLRKHLDGSPHRQKAAARFLLNLGFRGGVTIGHGPKDMPPNKGFARIARIYYYGFRSTGRPGTWDSALLDVAGKPRSVYTVLAHESSATATGSPRANMPQAGVQ
jgi:hypothetical protein